MVRVTIVLKPEILAALDGFAKIEERSRSQAAAVLIRLGLDSKTGKL